MDNNEKKPVAHYSQLKKHPKLLEFTVNRVNACQGLPSTSRSDLDELTESMKNKSIEIPMEYRTLMEEEDSKNRLLKESVN